MPLRHLLPLIIAALAAAPNAFAQYQWRDPNGRMVYSDMPPPASVPPSAVLRAPARQTSAGAPGGSGATASASPAPGLRAAASGTAAAVAPGTVTAATPARSAAEQEMDFRKRRLEREQAERKASEAQAATQRAAAVCSDARTQVRTLESGLRMARVNERGEREVVDEASRAAQLEAARRAIREHCPT
jgi:hypothetical protein